MELGTIGAVLSYAVGIEDESADFYERACSDTEDTPVRQAFFSLAQDRKKRKKVVERSRREFVNEMLLEPIEGLEGDEALLSMGPLTGLDVRAVVRMAKRLELETQELYADVAAKISHLPQLARVFRRLSQGNAEYWSTLDSLGD